MLHGPPILLPCLLCLAPVPRPAPSLPEAVFEALRAGDARLVKPLCALRQDWPEPPFLSGSGGRTKEDRAREPVEWEQRVAREVEVSVPAVRFYSAAVGFDWNKARLKAVVARALHADGEAYDPKQHDEIHPTLALVLRSGDKEMTVFVPTRGTPRGLRLAGPWVPTDLTQKERKAFRAWGHESSAQDIARLIARRHITMDFFVLNFFHGTNEGFVYGITVRLPAAFDPKRRDTIEWRMDPRPPTPPLAKLTLTETGADTLCFEGSLVDIHKEPIRLELDRLTTKVASTGTWDTYREAQIGVIALSAGRQRLTAHSEGKITGALIDLKSIRLVPQK
ncbi:MAG TPA: hypothetical protein VKD72_24800 [Gemmataceae bacterium]|nr:hypothetical protein [Gemmataceae bacterium]